MRESLMIRPFVELENSFLCTWHPSEGGEEERSWLPAFTSIIVEFSWKILGKIIPLQDESRVAIRVVVSFVRILLQILLQIRGMEMLSVD